MTGRAPPDESPNTPNTPPPRSRGNALRLTGERTLPGIPDETYWFKRHVVPYRLAAARAAGRTVLDAGCGEGYGAAMLAAAGATQVTAVDLDAVIVAHVARRYPQVQAVHAELGDLPLAAGSIQLAVALQVIEHVWDVPALLRSLRRVLGRGGELVISTPNRLTFTPHSERPSNPFHVREYAPQELRTELQAAGFDVRALVGVRHGPLLLAADRVLGRPLPAVLLASPPEDWPVGVRRLVRHVRSSWFRVRARGLTECLDLVAFCRPAPPRSPSASRARHRQDA